MLGEECGCLVNLVKSFEFKILSFSSTEDVKEYFYLKIGGKKRTIYRSIKLT
jgi:hypothetical protein